MTGASGYLATHVVQQLQAAGYKVRGTVRSLKNDDKVAPLRQLCPDAKYPIELVEADLLNPDSWDKYDTIYINAIIIYFLSHLSVRQYLLDYY